MGNQRGVVRAPSAAPQLPREGPSARGRCGLGRILGFGVILGLAGVYRRGAVTSKSYSSLCVTMRYAHVSLADCKDNGFSVQNRSRPTFLVRSQAVNMSGFVGSASPFCPVAVCRQGRGRNPIQFYLNSPLPPKKKAAGWIWLLGHGWAGIVHNTGAVHSYGIRFFSDVLIVSQGYFFH